MKKIFLVIAVLLASCAKEEKSEQAEQEQIILSASFSSEASEASEAEAAPASKATATAFEAGDELGLFVTKSGMEVQSTDNLVDNHKMIVGGDGAIKGSPTAVYYPTSPTSQVTLYSYYPYQSGNATADALGVLVGIHTDQTDFLNVKRSDLCFGSVQNITPSTAAQPITFKHSFSQIRVNIATFAGCSAIKRLRLINIKDSATLNIQTGAISLKPHTAEILTYPNLPSSFTAIIPAQTFAGACIAIDLVDPTDLGDTTFIYSATSPITLTKSATNTLNLSINEKGVVSLNGQPTITNWSVTNSVGEVSHVIDNYVTLRWLAPHASFATVDKIDLTITDLFGHTGTIEATNLVVDPLSSAEYAQYTFKISNHEVSYPAVIEKMNIYAGGVLIRESPRAAIIGSVLHRIGAHTIGLSLTIEIAPADDWLDVSGLGASRVITVSVGGATSWTASATGTGLTVTPTSGTTGQTATITWATHAANPAPAARSGSVKFETIPTGAFATINSTQNGVIDEININGTKWKLTNTGAACNWDPAMARCPSPWRLPSKEDFENLISSGRINETGLQSGSYWSSTWDPSGNSGGRPTYSAWSLINGRVYSRYIHNNLDVRCVNSPLTSRR